MHECSYISFITGTPQCGKTSFMLDILANLRQGGCHLGGFVSHGLWLDNWRAGFDLEVLDTGERVHLTSRRKDCLERGGYIFHPEGFAVGLRALAPAAIADKDLITVDEVGWLEVGGGGFAPSLPNLLQTAIPQIWVVRDGMIDGVCEHWQFTPSLIVHPDQPQARDTLINHFKTL